MFSKSPYKEPIKIQAMTDEEALNHMKNRTPLDTVRACLSGIIGAAEQASAQRNPPTPIELRKAEFRAVEKLLRVAVEQELVRKP